MINLVVLFPLCRYRESQYKLGRVAYVKLLKKIADMASKSAGASASVTHDTSEL